MSEVIFFAQARRRLHEVGRTALAFVFANVCPFCDKPIGMTRYYCEDCARRIPRVETCECPENIDRMYVCSEYSGIVRGAVRRMKRGGGFYAAEAFGVMLTERIGEEIGGYDFVTYIPSGIGRSFALGGEHSAIIAREISRRTLVPLIGTLKTVGKSVQQKRLSREERFENARNKFALVDKEDISGKNILLVDDICTTGATLGAAAALLKKAGAASVSGAVFAKTRYISHKQ